MTVRVLDLSHHQAKALGNGYYLVTANMALAREAGASAVIVRSNYGARVDTTAAEHNRRVIAAGLPRAYYWYHLTRADPRRQAEIAFEQSGSVRGVRGACDLEENLRSDGAAPLFPPFSDAYFQHVDAALQRCDLLTGLLTMIYSSRTWMDTHFTRAQQERWAGRLGWWAHWTLPGPGVPWVPSGWKGTALPWAMWQNTAGPWPGFDGDVDQSIVWPGLELDVIFGDATRPPLPEPVPAIAEAVAMIDRTRAALEGLI